MSEQPEFDIQPTDATTALSDPENVQLTVVPDDEVPGTGLTPNEVEFLLGVDPSLFGTGDTSQS